MRKIIFKLLKCLFDFGGKCYDGRSCIIIIEFFVIGICIFLYIKMNIDVINIL